MARPRLRSWKGHDRVYGGASLEQDPLRPMLRWTEFLRRRSYPILLDVRVPPAPTADAALVVRRLGARG